MAKIAPFQDIIRTYSEYSNAIHWNKEPKELYEPFEYIMKQQGKKIRPLSLLLSYNLFENNLYPALDAAYGIELFHNFTLIHDDIMDNADTRRGLKTIHKAFGNDKAILSGDAMLLESFKFMMKSSNVDSKSLSFFIDTAIEVCEGQSLDMNFEKKSDVSIEEYIEMIRLKTSVLLGASMKIGAQIAQQDSVIQEQLYTLGVELGIAFQIQDDYLDLYGSEFSFGKKKGGDLTQKKKTILLLTSIQNLKTEDRLLQIEHYNSERSDDEQIEFYVSYFDKNDIPRKVKNIYREYYKNCEQNIQSMLIDKEAKQSLFNFINLISNRNN